MIAINRKLHKYHRFITAGLYIFVLLLLSGCASAPVQEMSDARQAIQAAKEAGAQTDNQPHLLKAESLLKEAEMHLQNGDYKSAKHTATEARNEALRAQKAAFENSTTNP